MNCLDAREQFPAVVAGMSSLSELAPVEAHVGQCAECRKLLEKLYRMKPRNEPRWARPSTKTPTAESDESTNILEVVSPSRRPQRHALWAVLVAVAVTLGTGAWLAGYGSRLSFESSLVALLEGLRAVARQAEVLTVPAPPRVSAPPVAAPRVSAPPQAPPLVPTPPQAPPLVSAPPQAPPLVSAPPQAPPPVSAPPQAPPRVSAPPQAPPRVSAPPQAPPRVSPPRNSAPETTAATTPTPPSSAPEPKTTRVAKRVSAPPPASLPSRDNKSARSTPSQDAALPKPSPEAAIDANALVETGKIAVAVQLSVSNRKDAERDLGMLLARLAGTKLGLGQTSTLMASVPRSSYSEFTRGLSQIGSWRLEAGRASLPDPIHVAVKLAK